MTMDKLMHKERFFSALPRMEAQFGNLITLRERTNSSVPGLSQGFLASLIQFQPMLEIHLLDESDNPVTWKEVEKKIDPVESVRVFEADGLILTQKTLVQGNDILMDISLSRSETCTGEFKYELSGACLFSPQGVPYHWDEERNVSWNIESNREMRGKWQDDVEFRFAFSEDLCGFQVGSLAEEKIAKEHYFTSFNLKKRFTYYVPRDNRLGAGGSRVSTRNVSYSAIWEPDFDEQGVAVLAFRYTLGKNLPQDFPMAVTEYEKRRSEIQKEWDEFVEKIPPFTCGDKDLERIYYTSWYVLKAARISMEEERFRFPFTSVNKFHYYNQFFWDSAFQAIAWLWFNDGEPAENEMKNFVAHQWRNGMIPYELFMFSINSREWMDGDGKSTGTTQPPVIGITISEIFKKFQNKEYPAFFYDSLLKYETWLSVYRDLGRRGLSAYVNIWETGWDNSPRLDDAARNRVLDPYIEGVDFNVYIYLLRKTILDMARWLGKPEPEEVRTRMEMCRASMNEFMYEKGDGFYYDLEAGTDKKVKVKTAAGILTLMTDIPDESQRKRIVEQYVMSEEEFLTGAPFPSVSRSEDSYDPQDFWRGANWPQITWSLLYGLKDDNPEEAGVILDRFLDKTSRNDNCYEYYHSETGEGAGLPFQGWGALYTDFVIRFVAGLNPTEKGFRFRPVSKKYTDFSLENVVVKDHILNISRSGESWSISWEGMGELEFSGSASFEAEIIGNYVVVHVESGCEAEMKTSGNIRLGENDG